MRIRRVRLENFRLFEDKNFEFGQGLNLVRGPNESGKSTLVWAILFCLFENPASRGKAIEVFSRWGGSKPVVEMEFEHEGKEFLLRKDWENQSALLENLTEGKQVTANKAVIEKVREFTGFSDSRNYLRTACVTHDQMVNIAENQRDGENLAKMLSDVALGSEENRKLENAIVELESKVAELNKGMKKPASNPGLIKKLSEQIKNLSELKRSCDERVSTLREKQERLSFIETRLSQIEPDLSDLSALIEKNNQFAELQARKEKLSLEFERAKNAKETIDKLEKIGNEMVERFREFSKVNPEKIEETRSKITEIVSRESLAKKLVSESEEGMEIDEIQKSANLNKKCGYALTIPGLLLISAGILAGLILNPWLFFLTLPGAIACSYGVSLSLKAAKYEAKVEKYLERSKRTEGIKNELEELKNRQREILEPWGFKDASSFLEDCEAILAMLRERSRLEAMLDGLAAGRSKEEIEAQLRNLSLEAASVDAILKELESSKCEPLRFERLKREETKLKKEVEELKREKDALKIYLEEYAHDDDSIILEEKLRWLEEKEKEAKRRLEVSNLALDSMKEARRNLMQRAIPALEKSMAATFSELTGGRYDTVRVNQEDLGISVYSPEKKEMIPANELISTLSKGTVSQLYLSARLKLADFLSEGRKPPLIFDDSFSYFDDVRLSRLWQVLEEVASEQQIILLTCTRRYDNLLDSRVCTIDMT